MDRLRAWVSLGFLFPVFAVTAVAVESRSVSLGLTAGILSPDTSALGLCPASLAGATASLGLTTRASFIAGEEGFSGDGQVTYVQPLGGWTLAASFSGQMDTWDHLASGPLVAGRLEGMLGMSYRKAPGHVSFGLSLRGFGWLAGGKGMETVLTPEPDLPLLASAGMQFPVGRYFRIEMAAVDLGLSMKGVRAHGGLAWVPGDLALALAAEYALTSGRLPLQLGFEWGPGKLPLSFRGSIEYSDVNSGRLDLIPSFGASFRMGRFRIDYGFQFPTTLALSAGGHVVTLNLALPGSGKKEP